MYSNSGVESPWSQILFDIYPEKLLLLISRDVKLTKFPILSVSIPLNELLYRYKWTKFTKLPISLGISPDKLLSYKSKATGE